jgi:hypothetical protein
LDQAAFNQNSTQDFVDEMFTDEDHEYLCQEGRRTDKSQITRQQCDAIMEYGDKVAEKI